MTEPTSIRDSSSDGRAGPGFAEVAVDSPAVPGRTFSYSIPEGLSIDAGHLVRVPFGRRTLSGLVMSLAEFPQVAETRSILESTSSGPLLTGTQLALTHWISDHYLSPLFEAAALMLPPGQRVRQLTQLSMGPAMAEGGPQLTTFQAKIVDYVRRAGSVDLERLVRSMGEGARASAARLADRGVLDRSVRWSTPGVRAGYADHARLSQQGREASRGWAVDEAYRAPRQAGLLLRLAEDGGTLPLKDARKQYGHSAVKSLLEKGWIDRYRVPVDRDPLAGQVFPPSSAARLTERQADAAAQVRAALGDGSAAPRTFLLQGVTGSGKTEVYLDAVAHCLELGKKAIVLVPEIALAHQTVERFASRFPGRVAVLHSGLTAGQRFDQWRRVRRGDYDVVVGSRSAVFAPQRGLGLIVVDEEHEWTYKQHDASPRYHARDVALKLSGLTGAVVLMGSASPDISTYHRALTGRHRLLTLPGRVVVTGPTPGVRAPVIRTPTLTTPGPTPVIPAPTPVIPAPTPVIPAKAGIHPPPPDLKEAPLAEVRIVDMRRELREGNRDVFSRPLLSAMRRCLDDGGQMVLFLNRRGSSSYVQCRNCGEGVRCRRCEISLTYHRQARRLLCHYCGYRRVPPAKCPKCLSYHLRYYGLGTQSIVDTFEERFPGVPVLRWDRDAAKHARAYEELLHRFRSGRERVLVGTQMIAKGLHFPSVTLVGAVSADVGLNVPDYRAGERTFQLLCQVAGRAGRGTSPGEVIVQTYQPENYAIRASASQDYPAFYEKEIAYRREQANPPFGKLVRLLYSHTNRAICERDARKLGDTIRKWLEDSGRSDIDVLGPTPAYPSRLRGHYRWHIVLRGPDPRSLLDRVTVPQGWAIDVDPVALT